MTDDELFTGIRGVIPILKFLIFHEPKYRKEILSRMWKVAIPLLGVLSFVLVFDLAKLSPTGEIAHSTQSIIRWLCLSLLFLLFVTSLALVTKTHVRKWRDTSKLTSQELKTLIENLS